MKKFVFVLLAISVLTTGLFAQENEAITVEEAYLNAIEGVVIREMMETEGRDSKLVALQFIEDALENGRDSEDIQQALYSLATIGLTKTVREDGRLMNNYPDVRIKACELLGKSKNPEAKYGLKQVMYLDNEPSVITSAIRALSEIGYSEDDKESLEMINWINKKFDVVNPTSSLALEVLNAYEKIAGTVKDKTGLIEGVMRIASNYNYVTPVRNRAQEVLRSISGIKSQN
ncbi:MAG: HEAT repeat domain-containing protein [Treponemataceae bacterium]